MTPDVAVYEALAKDLLRRCMAEESPSDMRQWLLEQITRLGGGADEQALMTWQESFDFTDKMLAEFEAQSKLDPAERRVLTWPWTTWNTTVDTLEPGMLATVTAPDGLGKTIYAESIIEHWAAKKFRTVFVHYELNRKLMMLRRMSRHTSIEARAIKTWAVTPEQRERIKQVRPLLESWEGCISYLHTPEWSMERTIAALRKMHAEGLCDVVVLDYLEKAAASNKQLRLFGTNIYQREADNVEQLKSFAEQIEIPVLMIAQMSKAGKRESIDSMDRGAMRGAGEKSDKANLVILINSEEGPDRKLSPEVSVVVNKQTLGPLGVFKQHMRREYFRVADAA